MFDLYKTSTTNTTNLPVAPDGLRFQIVTADRGGYMVQLQRQIKGVWTSELVRTNTNAGFGYVCNPKDMYSIKRACESLLADYDRLNGVEDAVNKLNDLFTNKDLR